MRNFVRYGFLKPHYISLKITDNSSYAVAGITSNSWITFVTIQYKCLSHDVASVSEITPCIKLDKPLVVNKFSKYRLVYCRGVPVGHIDTGVAILARAMYMAVQ